MTIDVPVVANEKVPGTDAVPGNKRLGVSPRRRVAGKEPSVAIVVDALPLTEKLRTTFVAASKFELLVSDACIEQRPCATRVMVDPEIVQMLVVSDVKVGVAFESDVGAVIANAVVEKLRLAIALKVITCGAFSITKFAFKETSRKLLPPDLVARTVQVWAEELESVVPEIVHVPETTAKLIDPDPLPPVADNAAVLPKTMR